MPIAGEQSKLIIKLKPANGGCLDLIIFYISLWLDCLKPPSGTIYMSVHHSLLALLARFGHQKYEKVV